MSYEVRQITRAECEPYVMHIHYARRWPSITWAFGLFEDGVLCGIVSYGTPPSPTLRKYLAGIRFESKVIELNRLCLKNNKKNEASILVSRSIKLLPKSKIIVSYADTSQSHTGCVYQACNFIYTGLSVAGDVYKIKGRPDLHNITILDEFRGKGVNRAEALKDKYGDSLYTEPNSRKHRYIYIHGNQRFKKAVMLDLKYAIRKYPKAVDSIQKLESNFSTIDNCDYFITSEQLSSADFEDLLI